VLHGLVCASLLSCEQYERLSSRSRRRSTEGQAIGCPWGDRRAQQKYSRGQSPMPRSSGIFHRIGGTACFSSCRPIHPRRTTMKCEPAVASWRLRRWWLEHESESRRQKTLFIYFLINNTLPMWAPFPDLILRGGSSKGPPTEKPARLKYASSSPDLVPRSSAKPLMGGNQCASLCLLTLASQ
jgi:hypothetical protein